MATGRKRKFGYTGCGTDLIVFTILGALALWGIHHWNGLEHRPFGWGRVPVPAAIRNLPTTIHRLLGIKHSPTPNATPNAPAPTTPAPTATPPPAAATPIIPKSEPTPEIMPTPQPTATPLASSAPTPGLTVAAAVTTAPANVRASTDPKSAVATTLVEDGGTLYVGLDNGGIAIWEHTAKGGTVVAAPTGVSGPVHAVATGPGGIVYWIAGSNPAHVLAYTAKGKTLRVFDLAPLGPGIGSPDRLSVLSGPKAGETTLVLTSGGASPLFLDGTTGAQRDAADVLPADAASAIAHPSSAVYLSEPSQSGRRTLLVVGGDNVAPGQPAALSLWTADAATVAPTVWMPHTIDSGGGLPVYNRLRSNEPGGVGVSADGIMLLTAATGGQTLAAGQMWTGDLAPGQSTNSLTLQANPTVPVGVFGLWAPPERVARGRSGLWWNFGSAVLHTPSGGGPAEAYLPWNGAGDEKHGKISALIADADGAWVATDTGIHHIVPGHPDAATGFGGYLRTALGPDAARVPAGKPTQLDALAQQWQGTPYKWGGDTRAGIDCSGYVCKLYSGVGIAIPRATGELANGNEGKRVRDTLQYGDILVFPGHCAMYTGNGWTTEALDSGVGKAAIWSRKNVVVRRFLH